MINHETHCLIYYLSLCITIIIKKKKHIIFDITATRPNNESYWVYTILCIALSVMNNRCIIVDTRF